MAGQLKACKINCYCKFCLAEGKPKVKCTKQARYCAHDHKKHFACDEHVHLIEDTDPDGYWKHYHSPEGKAERKAKEREMEERDRKHGYSEADYQTWLRY